jgi:predicted nucleic acid binding AN1-type Zn finger protein
LLSPKKNIQHHLLSAILSLNSIEAWLRAQLAEKHMSQSLSLGILFMQHNRMQQEAQNEDKSKAG